MLHLRLRQTVSVVTSLLLAFEPAFLYALPTGGSVSAGSASINSSGSQTTITQTTSKAVINWTGFNTASGETVDFIQPSSSSIALNRISGGATSFNGSLLANGNVWLINPNGMLFGKNSTVNVGGLLATTSNIADSDFMNGNYNFTPGGNPNATITNDGSITVNNGGLVALVAPNVFNTGTITAQGGQAILASADSYAVDLYGDGLVGLATSNAVTAQQIGNSGVIKADGGTVQIVSAAGNNALDNVINMDGLIQANTLNGKTGSVKVSGYNISNTGTINASGTQGGSIAITGNNILQQGTIAANGTSGNGGNVSIGFSGAYIDTQSASTSATSISGSGGIISLIGTASTSQLFSSGTFLASGIMGGEITLSAAAATNLYAAYINASGVESGGTVRIGGGLYGQDGRVVNSATTMVNATTVLNADATDNGNGGTINVWSDNGTTYLGTATAKGGPNGGNGGLIEVSSAGQYNVGTYSVMDASAPLGNPGTILLDPKNIIVTNGGAQDPTADYFEFVNPDPVNGGTGFGNSLVALSTGNIVITNSNDSLMASNAGAVYLFNGHTGGLISTLTGSNANDGTGNGGIAALTNGNYVVLSPNWNSYTGAATWGSGTVGITGTVSASNSLVGSQANDNIGSNGITALTNGNYVVLSPNWNNYAGAATWGNGTTGVSGVVSSSNSLVGSNPGDNVGQYVTPLTNGNYVVVSSNWTNSTGAVTWGNGTTGVTGTVSSSNSLVGSTSGDQVGEDGTINNSVFALTNGNYVVDSAYWNGHIGAVTWGNGTTGVTGTISSSNSLVGSQAGDWVGIGNIAVLTNGNYVVSSPYWNGHIGAATWGNGTTGITGTVSSSNSLVGSTSGDFVGGSISVGGSSIIALTNGNYVVSSPNWNSNTGAATWGDGTAGITGMVSSSNSLVGSNPGDYVGSNVTALANGNYVVSSPFWNSNTGAATWGDGTAGITGMVSSSNSLVGSTSGDQVGTTVTALSNGNYVVSSPTWNSNTGAATWGDGTTGITGTISSGNSLTGSNINDYVSDGGIIALTNGNYVVESAIWNDGVGAATWGNGTTGTTGTISSSNSLVGSNPGDSIGNHVFALTNGNYVATSQSWNNNTGAVTWGNGSTGTTGVVSSGNSLVGSNPNDYVGNSGITATATGDYLIYSNSWNSGSGTSTPVVTFANGSTGISGLITNASNNFYAPPGSNPSLNSFDDTVNGRTVFSYNNQVYSIVDSTPSGTTSTTFASNASVDEQLTPSFVTTVLDTGSNLVLQANNDITVASDIIANNSGHGGNLTLDAGRSIQVDANITTDNGNVTLIGNERLSAGVVDANRDPGSATITTVPGNTINAGTGTVTIDLIDGAGKTNSSAGDVSLGGAIISSAVSVDSVNDIIINGNITTSGGAIVLNSDTNGAGAGFININNATLTSNGGDITLGGGSNPLTTPAYGTNLDVNGINLGNATLNAGGGNISLRGVGGNIVNDFATGVYSGNSIIETIGNGAIAITGTGGSNPSNANMGVVILGTTLQTDAGAITITGTGSSSAVGSNDGMWLEPGVIQTTSGAITINGTGGNDTSGVNGLNFGVLWSDGTITSATGNISITGHGGNGGPGNIGVAMACDGCPTLQSTGTGPGAATLTINGTAGNGTGTGTTWFGTYGDVGVTMTITSISSVDGDISIHGTGAGTGSGNYGIQLAGLAQIQSTGNAGITLTGVGANGAAAIESDIVSGEIGVPNSITSTSSAIKFVGDSLAIDSANTTISTGGNLTFIPYTTGTSVGVGSASSGSLQLPDDLLTSLTYGTLTLGGSNAGVVDINTTTTFTNPTTIISGAGSDITLDGALASSASGDAVTLASGHNFINTAGATPIDLTGGGRFLIYSTNPLQDTTDGLTSDFIVNNCVFSGGPCPSFPGTGNGFLYSLIEESSAPSGSGIIPTTPSTVTLATTNTGTMPLIMPGDTTDGNLAIIFEPPYTNDNSYHSPVCIRVTPDGACVSAH